MSSSLNLTLTDEFRAFIDRNCGDGNQINQKPLRARKGKTYD